VSGAEGEAIIAYAQQDPADADLPAGRLPKAARLNGASPTISVVICCHDERRWEDIVEALVSIERQTHPALETVVVVDHNPSLFERLREAFPRFTLLQNDGPRGAASSKNTGALTAAGDVVAFLDDDAVAADDWLEEIGNAHRLDPTILGIGGWTEPDWARRQPAWFPVEYGWVVGASYRGLPVGGGQVRNVTGGNMSVDRHAFAEAGGFDVNLGKVGARSEPEDTELCIRIGTTYPGRHWFFKPAARITHKVPLERESFRYFLTRCRYEGLGKAALTTIAGSRRGLASERSYALRVLSSGVAIRIREGVRSLDYRPFAQAAVLVIGLAATVAGFAEGRVIVKLRRSRASANDVA
jgi:GT2 family glycosyltransferase